MGYETGQFDSVDRQLMETGAPAKVSVWTEIGETEIVYTIFGKAKVRLVGKHDNMRRGLFLLLMLVIVIVVWQGWVLYERTVTMQNADILHGESNKLVDPPISVKEERNTGSNDPQLASSKKSESQPPRDFKDSKQTDATPVMHPPNKAIRPQSEPAVANNSSLVNQADKQFQDQPLSKTNVAPSVAAPGLTQSPASGSAVASPLANKVETPNSSTVNDHQMGDPINPKN
jgi:hypothetical protein